MSTNATSAPWIAYDAAQMPPRAWRMSGNEAQGAPVTVLDLDGALALAPECDLLTTARTGLPPAQVPGKPATLPVGRTSHPSGRVHALTPLAQSRPHGNLAGATCRVDGFLALNREWDGVICIPGPQATHWIQISADEVVSFLSFATLPLIAAMSPADVLSTTPDTSQIPPTLQDVMSKPENLALRLAETRSLWATGAVSEQAALGQIWGAALGAELAAARAYWLGQNLALIAPPPLAPAYKAALQSQYVPVTEADDQRMTLAGFIRARRRMG